jgi:hypothetical protein
MTVATGASILYYWIMDSSAGSEDRAAYVLAQINAGLVMQWSQIVELDASLQHLLDDAHALGQQHVPTSRRSDWDKAWLGLRGTLRAIHDLDAEAQKRFQAGDSSNPLEPWSNVFEQERKFSDHLAVILDIGEKSVPAKDQSTWGELCASIELQFATLNAHALTVRFQLELRQKYGRQKADALTKEIAKRFPKDANIADADKYVAEYRKAYQEFQHEQETFGGVWDFLKAMMLIQPKTPEDRVRDKYLQEHRERLRTYRASTLAYARRAVSGTM